MRITSLATCAALAVATTLGCASSSAPDSTTPMSSENSSTGAPSSLGAFSVSLSVKDIAASRAFYEKLGFVEAGGAQEQNWLILRNGQVTIGLFQGMFEGNLMTFNPGWNAQAEPIESFTDVREIQERLKAEGIELASEAANPEGPASITMFDPDGNVILIDQHVE